MKSRVPLFQGQGLYFMLEIVSRLWLQRVQPAAPELASEKRVHLPAVGGKLLQRVLPQLPGDAFFIELLPHPGGAVASSAAFGSSAFSRRRMRSSAIV